MKFSEEKINEIIKNQEKMGFSKDIEGYESAIKEFDSMVNRGIVTPRGYTLQASDSRYQINSI